MKPELPHRVRWCLLVPLLLAAGCARDQAQTQVLEWPFGADQSLLQPGSSNPFNPAPAETSLVGKVKSLLPEQPIRQASHSEQVIRTDPNDAMLARARLAERQGEVDQATKIYESLVDRFPGNPLPYHRLGVLAAKQGRFVESEQLLNIARQMGPPSVELLCDLGYLLYLQNRLDEAEHVLRDALGREPYHKVANTNLGLVLGMQRRFPESLSSFKRAGQEAEAHANLAYVMTQLGEMEQAKHQYLFALQLDNTMKSAASALLQLVEREGLQTQLAAQGPSTTRPLGAEPRGLETGPIAGPVNSAAPPRLQTQAVSVASRVEPSRLPPVTTDRSLAAP